MHAAVVPQTLIDSESIVVDVKKSESGSAKESGIGGVEDVKTSPSKAGTNEKSLKRTATSNFFGVSTLIMYKKVKDVHVLRQLILDFIIWLPYVIFFLGFVCFFHSVGNAHRVTEGLDLYFSTTDNPDANGVPWVDIQTEPDLWHYIDNVLVEELLFGEEYELSDHGAKAATTTNSRRRLKPAAKSKPPNTKPNSAGSGNSDDGNNHTEYKHTPGNHSGCDPNHLDKAVTLHYIKNNNVVAGGILMIQKRFVPAGDLFDLYVHMCYKGSHFKTLEGQVLPCAHLGAYTDSVKDLHGFNDPEVYKKLPGFKYHAGESGHAKHDAEALVEDDDYAHIEGYIIEVKIDHGETAQELVAMLKEYEKHHWLDEYTQSVAIEVALYNNNLKLWVEVLLEAEFDLAGSVKAKHHVQTINLEPYNFANLGNIYRFIFEILFFIIVIWMFVLEIMQIFSVKCNIIKYFIKYGIGTSILDILQLGLSFYLIGSYLYRQIDPAERALAEALQQSTLCHPPDLHQIIQWENQFLLICCINILLIMIRGLQFLLVTKQFAKIYRLLTSIGSDCCGFIVPLLLIMFFCTMFGHIMYGKDMKEFSSFTNAFFTIFQWMLATYDPTPLYDHAKTEERALLQLVFVFVITFMLSILMVNVVLAILVKAWDTVNDSEEDDEGIKERQDLIKNLWTFKFKSLMKMLFYFNDTDFLHVQSALKKTHPHPKVERSHFSDICSTQMSEAKANEMVSWFFNKKGQVITRELIDSMRAEEEEEEPEYPYLFQKIEAEKVRRKQGVINAIARSRQDSAAAQNRTLTGLIKGSS